jgi:hypothetical protein
MPDPIDIVHQVSKFDEADMMRGLLVPSTCTIPVLHIRDCRNVKMVIVYESFYVSRSFLSRFHVSPSLQELKMGLIIA